MKKVLCVGELLLRFSPAANGEWISSNEMPVFIGGAELNVATALALWNDPVKYFTALPDTGISKDIIGHLQKINIDTSVINFSGERLGIYYLQQGTDMKSAGTVFDRKHSSFATLETGVVNWNEVLEDVQWLHFSAIAPAVSKAAAALCKEMLEVASAKNIFISVDLNFRSLLWKYGMQPTAVMPELAKYCNLIMGNLWAANTLLGIPLNSVINDQSTKAEYMGFATESAEYIFNNFPNCRWVANTFRFDEGAGINYYATLNTSSQQAVSPQFKATKIVDKVGSGDCFMAGLIHGILADNTAQQIINFAAAAAFGKLQEKGDTTKNGVIKIEQLLAQYT